MADFSKIAETIRQGLFAEEFEKEREGRSLRETRDAARALDQSRFDESNRRFGIGEERAQKGDAIREAEEARRVETFENEIARGPQRTFAEIAELEQQRRDEDVAFRTEGQRLAGLDRADTRAYRQGQQEFQSEQAREAMRLREEQQENRRVQGIAAILQKNIDDFAGDEEKQADAERKLEEFLADPDGFIDRMKRTQGAPPEEAGPGIFTSALDALRNLGQDAFGG
jgi:hypothetical protein